MYQYFVKIVPTAYVKIDGQVSPSVSAFLYVLHNSTSIPVLFLSFLCKTFTILFSFSTRLK